MTVNVGGKEVKRGKEVVTEEKKEEVKFNPSDYWCEIILEKTTREKAEDKQFPTDAFNVFYVVDGKEHLDVTRSEKMINVLICTMIGMVKMQFRKLIMVLVL